MKFKPGWVYSFRAHNEPSESKIYCLCLKQDSIVYLAMEEKYQDDKMQLHNPHDMEFDTWEEEFEFSGPEVHALLTKLTSTKE